MKKPTDKERFVKATKRALAKSKSIMDKERLDWLQKKKNHPMPMGKCGWMIAEGSTRYYDTARKCIDAAMKAERKGEK